MPPKKLHTTLLLKALRHPDDIARGFLQGMSEGGRDDVPSCGNEDKRRLKPALSGGRIAADDQLSLRTGPTKSESVTRLY